MRMLTFRMRSTWILGFIAAGCLYVYDSFAQQIAVNRIELMPNMPSPYEMRNWKQVALGYDAFVFDFNRAGQYLPLIWWQMNTVNYPNHNSFGLHTVVGTTVPSSAEAINVLAAVVGASLAGIDKSNQNGYNWALMCEEYFNNRPEENVYLNHPVASSGDDWWYETMPNVFFYQLYDMYPNTGEFARQFTTVADRWLEAVSKMGGSTTPWHLPSMNYRAWSLSTMTPNTSDVPEPEAAGAIAWLLYNAYDETGNSSYRIGAEWAMEFLNSLTTNPSYELQLPYGAYAAARMNAEIGTTYDVEKLLNWCFDIGPLRQWGAIVGRWGGYDCHGLIGEVTGNDYAFIMNTFEHVGALVPLVRYDDRFARAVGKWVLNATNAARLFYPNYLPDQNQDSEAWAHQYDPDSYIAHEALRQSWMGTSPYATGDAITGGWGMTTLALYGSSHVGIFGGIVDTTNVQMILRLDVLKTDYFHDPAYPTYLYFNPYDSARTVGLDVGISQHDLYDAVTNRFLQTGVSGATSFSVPADAAVLLVITPSAGVITYDLDKTLIDGVIVDHRSGRAVGNYPPRIKSLAAEDTTISFGVTTTIFSSATDRDDDALSYTWDASGGAIAGTGSVVSWTAPNSQGMFVISCLVDDGRGGQDTATVAVEVVESVNQPPLISSLAARPRKIDLGATSELTCSASDPDGDVLTYTWTAAFGVLSGSGSSVTWTAPVVEGNYYVKCMVDDGRGGQAVDSIGIVVRDFSKVQTGDLLAYYPFNGNANDESGHGNHGTAFGATLVQDRFGNVNSAYYFDGINDFVRVTNNPSLNFQDAITVSFWMKVGEFFAREAYPLSHGNWENRWKVSITNESVRWTVKTSSQVNFGIKDLDSEARLITDSCYNITALYSGSDFEIYVNGELDAFSSWSGSILPTTIDFTIGQVLPNNNSYNFKGVIDDVRIYNYALSVEEIRRLYDVTTSVNEPALVRLPDKTTLYQNYPNPFNPSTRITYQLSQPAIVSIHIYDVLGREVTRLVDEHREAGYHEVAWDGKNTQAQEVGSGIYFYRMLITSHSRQNSTDCRKMLLIR